MRSRSIRLERRVEQRWPAFYDARHAATGVARALWPLIGPVLLAIVLVPILLLLAAVASLLEVELPTPDLPALPFPDLSAPGWLRAIGRAVEGVLSVGGAAAKYVVVTGAVLLGIHRTVQVRRRRIAMERIGRPVLLGRLAVVLGGIENFARAQNAERVGDVCEEHLPTESNRRD